MPDSSPAPAYGGTGSYSASGGDGYNGGGYAQPPPQQAAPQQAAYGYHQQQAAAPTVATADYGQPQAQQAGGYGSGNLMDAVTAPQVGDSFLSLTEAGVGGETRARSI